MERSELRPVTAGQPAATGAAASIPSIPRPEEALWSRLDPVHRPAELPAAWLALECGLVRGCRRGVLLLGPPDRGPFTVAAAWPEGDSAPPRLVAAAEAALTKRSGVDVAAEAADAAAPAVVAEPIALGGVLHGVVALEVTPRPLAELEPIRRQLRLGSGWIEALAHSRRLDGESTGKQRLETVLGLLAVTLEHEGFQGAATAFATELATELGCDRVSVGFLRGERARVRALSHSSHFAARANLVRAIESAMDEALGQLGAVVHPAPREGPPRASHAHAELARQFGAGAVCSVPMLRAGRPCGAITLERAQPFDARTLALLEVVAAMAGPALESLRREDRFVGAKLADAARQLAADLIGPHHVALKLAAGVLVFATLFLAFAQGDYRVTADAVLEPQVKRAAVAPFDGYVAEAAARAGDRVAEGALLAALDDRDLTLERIKWDSEHRKALKQHRQAMAERDAAQMEILAAAIDEARAELARIDDRLARARLRAPFDGVVVEGDLSQRIAAPVRRGEVLFEVAPLDAYRIHVKVGESDIDEIVPGQQGRLVLSALPDESFAFTVEKVTAVASAEEGRNTFRVEARMHESDPRLRPGVEGVAKLEVGRRRLLWIWGHDALDWLRLRSWAWLP
jgi:multidrug resistance efflux pump